MRSVPAQRAPQAAGGAARSGGDSARGLGPTLLVIALAGLILAGAPLAGAWLAGQPLAAYLEFPPRPVRVPAPGFSWAAFWLLAALIIAAVAPFAWRILRMPSAPRAPRERHSFPLWGWAALLWLAASWTLAWTRFPWFEPFQGHTFTPLWLGYIAVVNALTVRRKGSSLLTRQPWRFAALFPLSALFWWFFEYLNRFVGNWYYAGTADFGALEYTLFATLAFSTVLPAMASTAGWLRTFAPFDRTFGRWHPLRLSRPKLAAACVLVLTAASLAGLGAFRDYLFPLVWISPALLVVSLQALAGRATVFAPLACGDWRAIATYPAAALACGFFWEMWNSGSLVHWEYSIAYVDRFRIFEMPLLGYAGYLPFGIQGAVIVALVLDPDRGPRQEDEG